MVADPTDLDGSRVIGEIHRFQEITVLSIGNSQGTREYITGTDTIQRMHLDRINLIDFTFVQDHTPFSTQLDDHGIRPRCSNGLGRFDGLDLVGDMDAGDTFGLLLVGGHAVGISERFLEETVGRSGIQNDVHSLLFPCLQCSQYRLPASFQLKQ